MPSVLNHRVSILLSEGCPRVWGRLHTRYSPVCRSSASIATPVTARLACVRPAASVYPEPGSNSPLYKFFFFLGSEFMSVFPFVDQFTGLTPCASCSIFSMCVGELYLKFRAAKLGRFSLSSKLFCKIFLFFFEACIFVLRSSGRKCFAKGKKN